MWTPTVLICSSVATVLGNTDLAAGISNQHLYWLCTGVFWQSALEKHSHTQYFLLWLFHCGKYSTISYIFLGTNGEISHLCPSPGWKVMMSCPEKSSGVMFYLCSDWQAVGHQQAGQPLLIGWAPGKGRANAKGTLAPTAAPRWSKLWEHEGRE